MKRRNALFVILLMLVLEALPWAVLVEYTLDGQTVREYTSCLSELPVALGVVTPMTTVFLTLILAALSFLYRRSLSRGLSLAMLILDGIAAVAVLGTLLVGITPISCVIMLLLLVHFLLIFQTRKL